MTDEKILLAEGAYYFGNRMIYKNQDIGVTAPGASLVLTGDGEIIVARLRNIEDVEVKPVKKVKSAAKPVEDNADILDSMDFSQ